MAVTRVNAFDVIVFDPPSGKHFFGIGDTLGGCDLDVRLFFLNRPWPTPMDGGGAQDGGEERRGGAVGGAHRQLDGDFRGRFCRASHCACLRHANCLFLLRVLGVLVFLLGVPFFVNFSR